MIGQVHFDIQHDNPLLGREVNCEYKEDLPPPEMGIGNFERNESLGIGSVFTRKSVVNFDRIKCFQVNKFNRVQSNS